MLNENSPCRRPTMRGIVKKFDLRGFGIIDSADGSKVPLAWANKFPDHLLLHQKEIDAQIADMKQTIESSPIGKMHGMTGSISRHDGKEWDYVPNGIPELEAKYLLTTRQCIALTVEHHVQAYLG